MEPSRGLYGDFEDGILRGRAFGEIGGLICSKGSVDMDVSKKSGFSHQNHPF